MQIIQKLSYIFNFKGTLFKIFLVFVIFFLLNIITYLVFKNVTIKSDFRISKIFNKSIPEKDYYFLGNSKTVQLNSNLNNKIYSLGYNGFTHIDLKEVYINIKDNIPQNANLIVEVSALNLKENISVLCLSYIYYLYDISCGKKKTSFFNSFYGLSFFFNDLSIRNIFFLVSKDQTKKNLKTISKTDCDKFKTKNKKPAKILEKISAIDEFEINLIVEGMLDFHSFLDSKDKKRVYYYLSPTLYNSKYYKFINNYIYYSIKYKINKLPKTEYKFNYLKLDNNYDDKCKMVFDNIHLNFNGAKKLTTKILKEIKFYE